MIKVDYDYYKSEYGGINIPEERFPFLVKKAVYLLSEYTLGRSDKLVDGETDIDVRVKDCMCEICDKLYDFSTAGNSFGAIKTSETVGKVSYTYDTKTIPKSVKSSIFGTIDTYLGNTYLLCRWL